MSEVKWARWALENASTRRQVAGATGCSDVDAVLKAGKFKLEMLRARGKLPTSSKQMSLALIGVHRMGNFSIITKMMFKGKSNSGTNNFHCIGSIHKWSSGWLVFFRFLKFTNFYTHVLQSALADRNMKLRFGFKVILKFDLVKNNIPQSMKLWLFDDPFQNKRPE